MGEKVLWMSGKWSVYAEKTKAKFAGWYKKEKIRLWKRGQKIALPICEKNGPDSPSGLARTARSARLRFCLFRRFVFIQGVCLSRRGEAEPTCSKTSIRLSAKGVKYRDKSRRVWGVYNYKIIQMIDNLCKMCVLYSRYKLNFKNEGTITLVTGAFFAIHSLHSWNL